MQKTKQFNVFYNENPDALFLDLVDDETQELLADYFWDRYVTDDDRFIRYFTRNLKRVANKYNNDLRVETIQIDPMVTKYLEEQEFLKSKGESTRQKTAADEKTQVRTNQGTVTVKTDDTSTNDVNSTNSATTSGTHNETNVVDQDTTEHDTDTIRQRDLQSDMPHSNVSGVTSGGLMANVNWRYASGMTDHGEDNSSNKTGTNDSTTKINGTDSVTESGKAETTSSGKLDGTQVTTRNDGYTQSDTQNKNDSENGTETRNDEKRRVYTGRDGIAAEILSKTRDYIRRSTAFEMLLDELEICFMPDLSYGREDW